MSREPLFSGPTSILRVERALVGPPPHMGPLPLPSRREDLRSSDNRFQDLYLIQLVGGYLNRITVDDDDIGCISRPKMPRHVSSKAV